MNKEGQSVPPVVFSHNTHYYIIELQDSVYTDS